MKDGQAIPRAALYALANRAIGTAVEEIAVVGSVSEGPAALLVNRASFLKLLSLFGGDETVAILRRLIGEVE